VSSSVGPGEFLVSPLGTSSFKAGTARFSSTPSTAAASLAAGSQSATDLYS
jgi:hypothetical protein